MVLKYQNYSIGNSLGSWLEGRVCPAWHRCLSEQELDIVRNTVKRFFDDKNLLRQSNAQATCKSWNKSGASKATVACLAQYQKSFNALQKYIYPLVYALDKMGFPVQCEANSFRRGSSFGYGFWTPMLDKRITQEVSVLDFFCTPPYAAPKAPRRREAPTRGVVLSAQYTYLSVCVSVCMYVNGVLREN